MKWAVMAQRPELGGEEPWVWSKHWTRLGAMRGEKRVVQEKWRVVTHVRKLP